MFSFPYQVNLAPTTHTLSREAGHPIVGRVLPLRYKGRTLHFYSKLCISRGLHNPDEFTLEMRVDVERLKMGLFFHSLCRGCNVIYCRDSYPRSIRGRRNPDGCPRLVRGRMNPEYRELSQRRGKKISLFKPMWMVLYAPTAQARAGGYSVPARRRVDDNDEATTPQQAAAREELAGPPKKRQQQRMTAWTAEQSKQFDPVGQQ